jgi:hypothetical protein
MKTPKLLFLTILIFSGSFLFAQRGENLESLHTAFISQKLNLTDDEAKKFWPVYDQYHSDLNALKKEHNQNREMIAKAGGIDNMKDADAQKYIENETDIQNRELQLHKEYIVKFEQVLPAKKVAKFFIAEEEFKIYLLKQLGDRRGAGAIQRRESNFIPQ